MVFFSDQDLLRQPQNVPQPVYQAENGCNGPLMSTYVMNLNLHPYPVSCETHPLNSFNAFSHIISILAYIPHLDAADPPHLSRQLHDLSRPCRPGPPRPGSPSRPLPPTHLNLALPTHASHTSPLHPPPYNPLLHLLLPRRHLLHRSATVPTGGANRVYLVPHPLLRGAVSI